MYLYYYTLSVCFTTILSYISLNKYMPQLETEKNCLNISKFMFYNALLNSVQKKSFVSEFSSLEKFHFVGEH